MTMINPDTEFNQEITCTYKGEKYSVRNNGAVLRHPKTEGKLRPSDNQWTFGKPNNKTGYFEIATVRVHRIVAMAFHGEPPTKDHVVDHIDTNKKNNRPENLRWVTRFENVILNPITAKRIAIVCGSVEAFMADPAKFKDKFPEPNYQWMCTVSAEEAQNSLERLLDWASSDALPAGGKLGDWIMRRGDHYVSSAAINAFNESLTPNAVQINWKIPSEFPTCPKEFFNEPIESYSNILEAGSVFCTNKLYTSLVLKSVVTADKLTIYVLSESSDIDQATKPWALAKINYENGKFVHTNLGNFFTKVGAEKQFCLAQGLEWHGEDSIDDYC